MNKTDDTEGGDLNGFVISVVILLAVMILALGAYVISPA
jgi:hypothetical protein